MAKHIEFDFSEFNNGLKRLDDHIDKAKQEALRTIGDELLRLSQNLVPLDKGMLLNSSFAQWDINGDDYLVVYNKSYAAYQHEGVRSDGSHVVKHYTVPGRSSKYLERPMKENLATFKRYYDNAIKNALK